MIAVKFVDIGQGREKITTVGVIISARMQVSLKDTLILLCEAFVSQ